MSYTVRVHPADDAPEEPLEFENVTSVTLIDSNSHGPAAIGDLSSLGAGKRLLVCSPNVTVVEIEGS